MNQIRKIIREMVEKETNKNTKVVSGFPGIGKSHFFRNFDGVVLDSDSSNFSWIEKGVRNPEFPKNYIEHIKNNIGKADIILVSSHKDVRDALVESGIEFTLVYPDRSLKDEYIERYKTRGSDEKFVEMMNKNWDNFLDQIDNQVGCKKIKLDSGQYLSDVI